LPITFADVLAARQRIAPHLSPSPLLGYPLLDEAVGHGIRVFVKHENFNPTNAFKVRNGLSLVSALTREERARGLVTASRGNHGLGLSFAAQVFDARTTVCVPLGNNPDKNAAMRALGTRVIEQGRDYDESLAIAEAIVREEGATMAHSTNDARVIAGAATMSLEVLEQAPELDAMVIAVGGGSQAVGAITVARELRPELEVHGVQAAGASAAHDSWHARAPLTHDTCDTFADGLATRSTYAMTFPALVEGLAGFITVSDAEIADAVRLVLRTTHSLVEGAGACGLAGLMRLRERLAGKRVGIVLSGGNIDEATLRRILNREL
jgi:threonine dehydratase